MAHASKYEDNLGHRANYHKITCTVGHQFGTNIRLCINVAWIAIYNDQLSFWWSTILKVLVIN